MSTPEGMQLGSLFEDVELDLWHDLWQGMPEFIQEDLTPWKSLARPTCSRSRTW